MDSKQGLPGRRRRWQTPSVVCLIAIIMLLSACGSKRGAAIRQRLEEVTPPAIGALSAPAPSGAPPRATAVPVTGTPLETSTPAPSATATRTATSPATATPTATPLPTTTPSPVPSPTVTATATPLSPEAVLEYVAPSLVQVVTQFGTGNGFAVGEGMILTAAHVVYPGTEVTLYLPNGRTEFVPVQSVDMITDLALVGPVDSDLPALTLRSRSDLQAGDAVLVAGYDQTGEGYFTNLAPEINEGQIIERRDWPTMELTAYKTDIELAPGDSGSPLLASDGTVAGVAGIMEGDPLSLLALAVADLAPSLLGEGDLPGPARLDPGAERVDAYRFMITDPWSYRVAYLPEQLPEAWVVAAARGNAALYVYDCFGSYVTSTDDVEGSQLVLEDTEMAPYFVVMEGAYFGVTDDLKSSAPLVILDDPDDGRVIKVGETVTGALDYARDQDVFHLRMEAGQRIEVAVESFAMDPQIVIVGQEDSEGYGFDDDGGGGLRGLDALLTFEAQETGYHDLVVSSALMFESGGYVLSVREANDASPEAAYFDEASGMLVRETEVGPMQPLTSPDGRLSVLRPASMSKALLTVPEAGINCHSPNAGCSSEWRFALVVQQEPLYRPVSGYPTLGEWMEEIKEGYRANPAVELVEQRWVENELGTLPLLEASVQRENADTLYLQQLLLISQGVGYRITFLVPAEFWTETDIARSIEHSFANLALADQ